MSSRCASGSKSLRVTVQGGVSPSASCSRLVSRIAVPLVARTCPRMAPCTAPLKDASRRTSAVAPASAGPILDRGCARRRGVVRPGRRNGPFQPNKESSSGGWQGPPRQGADVSTHVQQRGSYLLELIAPLGGTLHEFGERRGGTRDG